MYMKQRVLASVLLTILSLSAASSIADERHQGGTNDNPIRLEGQIREIAGGDDKITIRLHRDRYPIVTHQATRVRWLDGRRSHADELQVGDSIRVEGNQERTFISADRVTILLRVERR
jgi:hypothetical protein